MGQTESGEGDQYRGEAGRRDKQHQRFGKALRNHIYLLKNHIYIIQKCAHVTHTVK